jgi:hypothetical protein
MTSVIVDHDGAPVEVNLSAAGAWHALYRRDFATWARLTAGRDLDRSAAQALASAACRAVLAS